jgi:hypothetical protein
MGAVLGVGLSHYPALRFPDAQMTGFLRVALESGKVPERLQSESNWPVGMQAEWRENKNMAGAAAHRGRFVSALREIRKELDAFRPDLVIVFGDDQYENFKEECIPPFCVFILDEVTCKPFRAPNVAKVQENVWGEGPDTSFLVKGHADAARALARYLISNDMDVAYAYRPNLPIGLAHAFINTVLFLDYDRKGFDYPVVPFHVNTYGSRVIQTRGGWGHLLGTGSDIPDPPGPTPRRTFDVGRAVARFCRESDWRVAIVASASWSHAFQNPKGHWINPDIEGDRVFLDDLRGGTFQRWRDL